MRYRPSRFSPLVAAASATTAGFGLVGRAFGVYTATNIVTASTAAPFVSTDALGTSATYTGVSVSTTANHGDGPGYSTFVGTLSGNVTGNSSASVSSPFAYDPVNGFRYIGVYTGTSTGAHTNVSIKDENSAGQVVGYSGTNSAQSSATTNSKGGGLLGYTAWLYTTNANPSNGTPANYEQALPGLTTGTNFSFTQQYNSSSAVASNGTYTGTYRYSQANYVSGNGLVVGTTARYTGDTQPTNNSYIGQSTWLYTPGVGTGTTVEVGLTDTNHSYADTPVAGSSGTYLYNNPSSVNNNGNVAGTSSAFYDKGTGSATALGTDGFIYYGGQSTAIGLYQYGNSPAGLTTGAQYYYTPAGGGAANLGAAYYQARSTSIKGMNATGSVIGTSSYYASGATTASSPGADAFVYTPTGAGTGGYNQLGLISNSFTASPAAGSSSFVSTTGGRSSTPVFINNNTSGVQVAGTSTQYYEYTNSANTLVTGQGTAAWVQNTTGGMPTQIGLFGQLSDVAVSGTVHVDPRSVVGGSMGVGSSTVTNLTDTGYIAGTAARYRSDYATSFVTLGQDAWVYDSNSQKDYIVAPPDETLNGVPGVNANNFVSTTINYLSEDGVAVGSYNDTGNNNSGGSPSGSFNNSQAFIWSEANGFVALDNTLSPSLSAAGYQQLISAYFDGGGAGSTIYASASSNSATNAESGNSYVALTGTVPEPTSLSIVAIGATGLLRRRRLAKR